MKQTILRNTAGTLVTGVTSHTYDFHKKIYADKQVYKFTYRERTEILLSLQAHFTFNDIFETIRENGLSNINLELIMQLAFRLQNKVKYLSSEGNLYCIQL